MLKLVIIFYFLFIPNYIQSSINQRNRITLHLKNQPNTQIILGNLQGDKFTPIDSTHSDDGVIKFQLPENLSNGMYRIILGQTTYAKVMNQPPSAIGFYFQQ
jgi:hypothetical protein